MTPQVREDWLRKFVKDNPQWDHVVAEIIRLNAFFVMPASKGWRDGMVNFDTDMLVYEEGIKGPPPAFRFAGKRITCVNYPASYGPMTANEFVNHVRDIKTLHMSLQFIAWIEHELTKDVQSSPHVPVDEKALAMYALIKLDDDRLFDGKINPEKLLMEIKSVIGDAPIVNISISVGGPLKYDLLVVTKDGRLRPKLMGVDGVKEVFFFHTRPA